MCFVGKFKGKSSFAACYQSCLVNMITAFTLHHIKSQMLCDISTIVKFKEAFLKCSDPSLKLDACCQRWKQQRSDLEELVGERGCKCQALSGARGGGRARD